VLVLSRDYTLATCSCVRCALLHDIMACRILERLGPGFDYVDVISAHRPDEVTPIEETVRGFNYLIDSGQALYWGTSNWTAAQLTEV
jgi:aryl-alcohol dehydrogenase-like predicted oxidoreductase